MSQWYRLIMIDQSENFGLHAPFLWFQNSKLKASKYFETITLYFEMNRATFVPCDFRTSKAPDTNLGDKLQARNWAAFVELRGRERGWNHQQKSGLTWQIVLKCQHFSTWVSKTYAVGLFSHVWPRFQMRVWEHLLPGNPVQISIVEHGREFWPQTSQLLGFHVRESWIMLASWISRLDFWGFEFWRETVWYHPWFPFHWVLLSIKTRLEDWHHLLRKIASL